MPFYEPSLLILDAQLKRPKKFIARERNTRPACQPLSPLEKKKLGIRERVCQRRTPNALLLRSQSRQFLPARLPRPCLFCGRRKPFKARTLCARHWRFNHAL
jgi:hypothetical protein